jgi:Ca-activated chloride channel family protein
MFSAARLLTSVATLAFFAAASVIASGQQVQPTPVFKSEGVTVSIHATVSDAGGRLVPDLTAADFTVLDNGRPQPLTVFERRALPISVAVLLDSSESMRDSIDRLRSAAHHFVAQLQPGDRVQIGTFNKDIRWVRPFTSDRRELGRVLNFFNKKMVNFGTALWPAIDTGFTELEAVDGRKVLLVFSDGEGNIGGFGPMFDLRSMASNVMVYAIALKTEYRGPTGRSLKSALDPKLPQFAADSGGGYFELADADDLRATFARVAEELRHQYTLGFEAPEVDGKPHEISVQVTGQGRTVRARRSYVAR